MMLRAPAIPVAAFCVLSLALGACSSTPNKKEKKRTVLMTEYDDSRVGEQASVDVAAQMGVLDAPDLNAYITEIGLKLLRGLPRRSFRRRWS